MAGLVTITQQEHEGSIINGVSARELWEKLEIQKDFADWIKQQIARLGLEEARDYVTFSAPPERGAGNRGARIEYFFGNYSLDF